MFLMKDIRELGYQFEGMKGDGDAITKQINSLKYLEHLSQVTETDITDWPIKAFLNTNGRVYVERQDLNEKFFEYKAKVGVLPKEMPQLSVESLKPIEDNLKAVIDRQIARETRNIDNYKTHINDYAKTLLEYERKLMASTIVIQSLNKVKSIGFKLHTQVQEIIADGYWTLSQEVNALQFESKPVSLTYFSQEHRRNNAVHFGTLLLTFSISDGVLNATVSQGKGAAHNGQCPHPHVSSSGTICFGELKPHWAKACATLDLVQCCKIVKRVLATYNEDDAFMHLYDYENLEAEEEEEEDYYERISEPEDENYDDDTEEESEEEEQL